MKNLSSLFFLVLIITACGNSKHQDAIRDYLQLYYENNSIDLNITIKDMELVRDWTVQDSLKILRYELEEAKNKRIQQVQFYLSKTLESIDSSEKVLIEIKNDPYTSSTKISMFEGDVKYLKAESTEIRMKLTSLNEDCKGTSLEYLYNKVQRLDLLGNHTIGFVYKANYEMDNPLLKGRQSSTVTFILDKQKNKVLGILN